MLGTLYIIATPIGNLEDMTFRAVRTLKEVDFVFAEDTRTTGILFSKYEIGNKNLEGKHKLVSYNAHNHRERNLEIIKLLEAGKNVGLVSDAGTPGISDPGYSAVAEVRKHFLPHPASPYKGEGLVQTQNIKIITIPGPSALTAFVSILGVGSHAWTFYGFLPHKNGRQTMLKEMLASENSSIFYESTHRIEKFLLEVEKLEKDKSTSPNLSLQRRGIVQRKIAIGKELTKIYEEILIGTPSEILEIFKDNPQKKKGEFVVMII